ncbi:MAG: Fic family protein [Armatimonadota bacterium]
MNGYNVPLLPPTFDHESRDILKKLASTHRYLAELKGESKTIPNQGILINTLALQEAKDSSAVENIITTHDDLYKEELGEYFISAAVKEVSYYSKALRMGFESVRTNRLLTVNQILAIHKEVKRNDEGIRRVPGVELQNDLTGETVYVPPQDYQTILALLANFEQYINDDSLSDADPLVKMAVMHYQFESIHPFSDGNGRTGRILNVLYLVLKGLLDIPVLYLSRYITQRKGDYYRLLQAVREEEVWEEWVLFMLDGIEKTSQQTSSIIRQMGTIMMDFKHRIRSNYKFYSQDLLNNLFFHPYTKIDFLVKDLGVSRPTATKYLDTLAEAGFLRKEKLGKTNYYINLALFDLLANVPPVE